MPRTNKAEAGIVGMLLIGCPECSQRMKVSGHDASKWIYDEAARQQTQVYYVSCPCKEKLVKTELCLHDKDKMREGAQSQRLFVTTTALPLPEKVDKRGPLIPKNSLDGLNGAQRVTRNKMHETTRQHAESKNDGKRFDDE